MRCVRDGDWMFSHGHSLKNVGVGEAESKKQRIETRE